MKCLAGNNSIESCFMFHVSSICPFKNHVDGFISQMITYSNFHYIINKECFRVSKFTKGLI